MTDFETIIRGLLAKDRGIRRIVTVNLEIEAFSVPRVQDRDGGIVSFSSDGTVMVYHRIGSKVRGGQIYKTSVDDTSWVDLVREM